MKLLRFLMRSKKKPWRFSLWQVVTFILGAILLTLIFARQDLFEKINSLVRIPKSSSQVKIISPQELKNLLAKKVSPGARLSEGQTGEPFFLINVHTLYEGEIVKTDLFVPFEKIEENKDKLPADKNTKIILYCQSGKMSETAVKKLVGLGYTNVSHLKGGMEAWRKAGYRTFNIEEIKKLALPEGGFSAPVKWGNLGSTLVSLGVIDLEKFKKAVNPNPEQLAILEKEGDQPITINQGNAQFVVDVLWALGLAQKSKVYTEGPMGKEYKEKVGNFASTGGWTLAKGPATNYLNRHEIVKLNSEQQNRVFEIAKNVYRPCCGNHTAFPDCNHGMAALGLIELMVAGGFSDEEIYKTILGFNSFWFPQSYLAAAAHFSLEGKNWQDIDAKQILGQEFSSGQGAAKISQEIGPLSYLYGGRGGSCGV